MPVTPKRIEFIDRIHTHIDMQIEENNTDPEDHYEMYMTLMHVIEEETCSSQKMLEMTTLTRHIKNRTQKSRLRDSSNCDFSVLS